MRHVRCAKAVAEDPAVAAVAVIAAVDLAGAAAVVVEAAGAVVAMAKAVVAAAAAITNENPFLVSGCWFLVSASPPVRTRNQKPETRNGFECSYDFFYFLPSHSSPMPKTHPA